MLKETTRCARAIARTEMGKKSELSAEQRVQLVLRLLSRPKFNCATPTDTLLSKNSRQEVADIGDLLHAHRMRHKVIVPLDTIAEPLQEVARGSPHGKWNDDVLNAVSHKDRDAAVRRMRFFGQGLGIGT